MGKKYGIFSRVFLSYDLTALAILYLSIDDVKCRTDKGHCVCNPFKKCRYCSCEGDVFSLAGAVNVILSYYKLKDTKQDGNFFEKIIAGVFMLFLHHSYKKASYEYTEIDSLASEMMQSQYEAEKSNSGIDKSADATATFLSKLLILSYPDNKALSVFGYGRGRNKAFHLIDAADDLENDVKHNNFNPFSDKYLAENINFSTYCEGVLNATITELCKAYDLLDLNKYKGVLDNIFYEGLQTQTKKCINKYKDIQEDDDFERSV